jgi:hypothetical protein
MTALKACLDTPMLLSHLSGVRSTFAAHKESTLCLLISSSLQDRLNDAKVHQSKTKCIAAGGGQRPWTGGLAGPRYLCPNHEWVRQWSKQTSRCV